MEGPHLHGQQLQGRRAGKSTQNPRAPAGPHLCVLVPLLTWRVLDTHSPFERTGLPRTHTDLGPGPSPQPGGHLPLPQGSPSSRPVPGFLERTTAPQHPLSSVLLSLWVFAPLAPLPRAPSLPALHLDYCSLLSEETHSCPGESSDHPSSPQAHGTLQRSRLCLSILAGSAPPEIDPHLLLEAPALYSAALGPELVAKKRLEMGMSGASPHQGNEEGLPPPGRLQGQDVCDKSGADCPREGLSLGQPRSQG